MGGKLYIVGVGLSSDLITLRGVEILKKSARIFYDRYTSLLVDGWENLKERLGIDPIPLGRKDLEENLDNALLRYVSSGEIVALLVPGNPLVATTHISIVVEAAKKGLKYEVVPAPGIIPNALTLAGLMIYKMGKPVTLVYPHDSVLSEYPYDVIKENDKRNLHTLLLLELDAEKGVMMSVKEAIDILETLERRRKEGILSLERKAVAVSGLGGEYQRICYASLGRLRQLPPDRGPHTIIITSPELHFMEEEALEVISNVNCR
jgi:diphthine synthase